MCDELEQALCTSEHCFVVVDGDYIAFVGFDVGAAQAQCNNPPFYDRRWEAEQVRVLVLIRSLGLTLLNEQYADTGELRAYHSGGVTRLVLSGISLPKVTLMPLAVPLDANNCPQFTPDMAASGANSSVTILDAGVSVLGYGTYE